MRSTFLFFILASVTLAIEQTKILGGQNAEITEFPFLVSLQIRAYGLQEHICGGAIIDKRWILTAGHCMTTFPDSSDFKYYIRAGITDLTENGGQEIQVEKIFVHDEYPGGVAANDIALLFLESELQFNDKVQKAQLPKSVVYNSQKAVVSGWGVVQNSIDFIPQDLLQKAEVNILTHGDCVEAFNTNASGPGPLNENNICTGPLSGGISPCSGDSGGPLSQNGTLIGIVSWGLQICGLPGVPAVYTKVSSYLDFIQEIQLKMQ